MARSMHSAENLPKMKRLYMYFVCVITYIFSQKIKKLFLKVSNSGTFVSITLGKTTLINYVG